MTAVLDPPRPTVPRRVESQPVNTRRAIASEWIKFRTLRSTWVVLGVAVLSMWVLGLVVAYGWCYDVARLLVSKVVI